MASNFKIKPAVQVHSLSEAAKVKDRIAVLCTIVNLNPEELSAIVSDASKEAKLLLENPEFFRKFHVGDLVRVFGTAFLEKSPGKNQPSATAFNEDNNILINVESLQSMSSVDLELYNQIRELEAKLKVV